MLKHTPLVTFLSLSSFALAASTALSADQITDPAVAAIRKLQPSLKPARAIYLARTFRAVSQEPRCQMPWQILVAISFNESSLGISNHNAKSHDFGLMQVNRKNILRYGLSQDKLMTDAAYSIRFACKLLRENKDRYGSKHSYWLGLYRSGTALWREEIVANAKRYDKIVRTTAEKIGYPEHRLAAAR